MFGVVGFVGHNQWDVIPLGTQFDDCNNQLGDVLRFGVVEQVAVRDGRFLLVSTVGGDDGGECEFQ